LSYWGSAQIIPQRPRRFAARERGSGSLCRAPERAVKGAPSKHDRTMTMAQTSRRRCGRCRGGQVFGFLFSRYAVWRCAAVLITDVAHTADTPSLMERSAPVLAEGAKGNPPAGHEDFSVAGARSK